MRACETPTESGMIYLPRWLPDGTENGVVRLRADEASLSLDNRVNRDCARLARFDVTDVNHILVSVQGINPIYFAGIEITVDSRKIVCYATGSQIETIFSRFKDAENVRFVAAEIWLASPHFIIPFIEKVRILFNVHYAHAGENIDRVDASGGIEVGFTFKPDRPWDHSDIRNAWAIRHRPRGVTAIVEMFGIICFFPIDLESMTEGIELVQDLETLHLRTLM